MSFDSRTNTINLQGNADLSADTGSFFLRVLKDIGSGAEASGELAADWSTVATWLNCGHRDLTAQDYDRFGLAFRSYLAEGIPPSPALEKSFEQFARAAKTERWPVVQVPPELSRVFGRMLGANVTKPPQRPPTEARQFAATLGALGKLAAASKTEARPATGPASQVALNPVPLAASIALLLTASVSNWPYGFYQFLRLVVTATSIYGVIQTAKRHPYWPWVMSGIAILFNPIVPVSFSRDEWAPIDLGVAVVFFVGLIPTLRRFLK